MNISRFGLSLFAFIVILLVGIAQVMDKVYPEFMVFDCKLQRIAYRTVGHVPQCEKDALAAQKAWSSKK